MKVLLDDGTEIDGVEVTKDILSLLVENRSEMFTKEQIKYFDSDEYKEEFDLSLKKYMDDSKDAFSTKNRDMTLWFCSMVASGQIPQFSAKADVFDFRSKCLMFESQIYKFKNDFVKLLVEKQSGESGFRNMPFNDIFVEANLKFRGHTVFGIHLKYCHMNGQGQMVFEQDFNKVSGFDNEGISIFVNGVDTERMAFYSHMTLDKFSTLHNNNNSLGYSCPFCNQIMSSLNKRYVACVQPDCIKNFQNGTTLVYDILNEEFKDWLSVMKIDDLRTIEEDIRIFVSNFLDFITNPEVRIHNLLSEEERARRNKKRLHTDKKPLSPIKIVNVDGFLDKYLTRIKNHFGTYSRAKSEVWVSGHYIRFWMRDYWHHIYDIIKGLKTDEEIIAKLKKYKRKDKEGCVFPLSMQYQWDSSLKVIKVWKMGFVVNEGKKSGQKKIFVVDTG